MHRMPQSVYYLKWLVMDQFDFKRFTFDHESQAQAFKDKIWKDLHQYQAISFQTEATHLAKKKLCAFDMDSTLINQEVIDEIARLFGMYDQVAKITERAMQGGMEFSNSLRERCKLFTGMPQARLQEIIPKLSLSPGAKELLLHLQLNGLKTAIVSGGFEFVLKHFQTQLKIDQVHGHVLDFGSDGNFSGTVQDPIIDGLKKRELVSQMKQEYHASFEETIAVGDGANDIEMMKEAGISVSFHGKSILTEAANTWIGSRDLKLLIPLI